MSRNIWSQKAFPIHELFLAPFLQTSGRNVLGCVGWMKFLIILPHHWLLWIIWSVRCCKEWVVPIGRKKASLETVDLSWLLGYPQRDLVAERGRKKMRGEGLVFEKQNSGKGLNQVVFTFFLSFKCATLERHCLLGLHYAQMQHMAYCCETKMCWVSTGASDELFWEVSIPCLPKWGKKVPERIA